MIHQNTIDQVRELDIVQVIGKYVTLSKKGNSYKGLSPFSNEKTPSFTVSTTKQFFKCFSSGQGGDGIAFVQLHSKLNFYEAIKQIAQDHAIAIEYVNETPEKKKEREAKQANRKTVTEILNYALSWFAFKDLPKSFSKFRGFPSATTAKHKLGYAPSGKRNFYEDATKLGFSKEALTEAGLIRITEKGIFDVYQDRIIFPIFDLRGNVVAFTGRTASEPQPDAAFIPPKYINSPDTIWSKGSHLYGLNLAIKDNSSPELIYLVEGQTDVIRMHKHGFTNTVCPGGTALTVEHCKLINRFTDKVVYIPDNDLEKLKESGKNPGIDAMHRNIPLLLQNGLTVSVLIPGNKDSIKDIDPDDWLRKLHSEEEVSNWFKNSEDYIIKYLHRECLAIGDSSPKDMANQIARMAKVIELITNTTVRNLYYTDVAGLWPAFKKEYKLKATEKTVSLPQLEKLNKTDKTDYFDYEFWEKGNAYYSMAINGKEIRFTNFKVEVLYFVVSDKEPQYICIFTNMIGKRRIKAILTDDFTSVGAFKKTIGRLGPFFFEGTDHHLNKIKNKLLNGVKEVAIPQYLGYNNAGDFFTWANGLYNGSFNKADKYGIVELTKSIKTIEQFRKLKADSHILLNGEKFIIGEPEEYIKEQTEENINQYIKAGAAKQLNYYYLPFAATLKISEHEEDKYEFESRFRHFEKAETSFNTWAKLMADVYGSNGKIGVLYYIMALFRDVIFKANNSYVPILGLFGPRQSGKSTMARSLGWMYGEPLEDGVNLESGSTATGIRRVLSSCQNAIITLNEYKNSLPISTLGMIKGIADGSGKLTGVNTSGNETKNYKPRSCVLLVGQDLPTQDPALFSRNITLDFDGLKRNYEAFKKLTDLEKGEQATSVTCELLQYRKYIKEHYAAMEPYVTKELRKRFEEAGIPKDVVTDRMVLNFSSILTPFHILSDAEVSPALEFPFTMDELLDIFTDKARFQAEVQSSSDDVEKYLSVVASLVNKEIYEGTHYKIEVQPNGPTLLYLRIHNIHTQYRAFANRSDSTAYDISTIKQYLAKHSVFIDFKKSTRFKNLTNSTSAMVLDYDRLREMNIDFATETQLDKTAI